jgi:hypothetical protein
MWWVRFWTYRIELHFPTIYGQNENISNFNLTIIIRFTVVGIENEKVENSVFIGLMNMYILKTNYNTAHRQNKKLMHSTSEAHTSTAKGKRPRSQRAS